jgi:hypothetical protein
MINLTKETMLDIQNCMNDYSAKINKEKPFKLSLSSYKVDKPWGYEIWLSRYFS